MIETPTAIKSYCVVCNEVARDCNLSARAKGIYYYLATLPSSWKLSKTECQTHFTEGVNAFTTAFNELEKAGYILKTKVKNAKNHFVGWEYKVLWSSISDPMENLKSENRPVGNPPLLNTKEVITERVNTKTTKQSFKSFNEKEFSDEVISFSETSLWHEEFIDHWTEKNTKGKMLFQLQKTWNTSRRLKKWAKNNFSKLQPSRIVRHRDISQNVKDTAGDSSIFDNFIANKPV